MFYKEKMFVKVVSLVENNKKSQAELYREERKARLAKAAAKKAKSNPKKVKTKKLAKKVIAIVLAVGICLSAVLGMLSFFDVPEKAIKVTFQSTDGKMTYKMSGGEFNYYYLTTFFNIYQEAAYYEQMGQGMGLAYTGFDYSKAPSDQPLTAELLTTIGVTLEELGNPKNPTWSDAITYFAINNFVSTRYGAEMAKKNNISLSEEDKTTVKRARRVQRFMSQPFHVAESFTSYKGVFVPVEKTLEGMECILGGECDNIPEQHFLMCGTIDDVYAKSKE